ncbi:ArdC family protein [uncultured Ilyobacter sp.]|uniref:ArdC family protein n=1 Tax=uncultured Ilyobacter sp. TaxID=544433 RepID=UPI0029C04482|nr:ArdC family protein [uncultured Ilyobacter sp.]
MKKVYSAKEKREYFARQIKDLKDGIEDKIKNFIEDSAELKQFIEFRRKHFYSYSINNTILIQKQVPGASCVAGFKQWKKLGYSVRKGERAIKILVPLIRKVEEKTGEDEKQILYGFKVGNVFDRSQVEAGENAVSFPQIDISVKEGNCIYSSDELYSSTKQFVEQLCPVEDSDSSRLGASLGMTDGKNIYVKSSDNKADMSAILVHEFTHYHNHFKDNRKELSKDHRETEAELGSLIFGSYFDLDIEGTYKYLAMYRDDRDLTRCFETAYKTFEYIMDGNEEVMGLESILQSQNQ